MNVETATPVKKESQLTFEELGIEDQTSLSVVGSIMYDRQLSDHGRQISLLIYDANYSEDDDDES